MKFTEKQILIILGGAAFLIILIVIVFFNLRSSSNTQPVKLTVWGIEDGAPFAKIAESYKKLHSNVDIAYAKIDENNYENTLVEALAAGRGPDIFIMENRALPRSKDRLTPVAPAQFGLLRLRSLFPTVVEQDFVSGGQIYALPLYIDTMAMLCNKDIFDQAGVVFPPKTWNEFQGLISQLRKIGSNGQIERAAAAIGGSGDTVDSGADLIHLLMLQNGAQMVSPDFNYATFNTGGIENWGLNAFNFYLQFANVGSPYYTWNDGQPNSIDSFAAGNTAIIFDYHSVLNSIKKKSPFLNVCAAPMPQPESNSPARSYARYNGLAVSQQSRSAGWAWDFVIYLTTSPNNEKIYLEAADMPPALLSMIQEKLNDPNMSVFARQALTARSWYQVDDLKIRDIFDQAIKNVLIGRASSRDALSQSQDQISQLMRAKIHPN